MAAAAFLVLSMAGAAMPMAASAADMNAARVCRRCGANVVVRENVGRVWLGICTCR
jgi:hypothetical protein